MTQLITKADIQEFGITIPSGDITSLVDELNNQLEASVGTEIASTLSDEQLDTLLTLQDAGDEQAVGSWLRDNVTALDDIIIDERDILLGTIADNTKKLQVA